MAVTSSTFDFSLNSTFKPFSLQEMLVPFNAYKEAYEKSEEAYNDLIEKSDAFSYLSETLPEGSKARQIYEGYAQGLKEQAADLSKYGLSMGNRRALASYKRRYTGEIGRLNKADEAMKKEVETRRAMGLKDPSMLYATENLNIDDFLDGNTPNLYGISSTELYTRGAAAGKAASSRVYRVGDKGRTLGGFYRDFAESVGYDANKMAQFRQDISTIPELQKAADDILMERGVYDNLSGAALQRARQSVINGMIDGAIYQEKHNPMQDLGVLTAAQNASLAMDRAKLAQADRHHRDEMGLRWASLYASLGEDGKRASVSSSGKGKKGSKGSSDEDSGGNYTTLAKDGILLEWDRANPSGKDNNPKTSRIPSDQEELTGSPKNYSELPQFVKDIVKKQIGNGDADLYNYYYQPYEDRSFIVGDDMPKLMMVPKEPKVYNPRDYSGELEEFWNQ